MGKILLLLSIFVFEVNSYSKINAEYKLEIKIINSKDTNVIEYTYDVINLERKYMKVWSKELKKLEDDIYSSLSYNKKQEFINNQKLWTYNKDRKIKILYNANRDYGLMGRLEVITSEKAMIIERIKTLNSKYNLIKGMSE